MSKSSNTSRPGAMSLLDKYASINSSIEDARRRVAEVRSKLERSNDKIHQLREERNGMLEEAEQAKVEQSRMDADLKEAKEEHRAKVLEKDRAQREHQLAKLEYDGMRRRIDDERMGFLERCREFRASCKRMRVAASILVLDGGGNFDAKDASDEIDLWRRLEDEDFSDDDEEEGGDSNNDKERSNKRKHKKADPEVELAETEEKESRQALIEAECALHAESMKQADATKMCNARTQRLAQQRAQLQKHRKEVEDLEREIQSVKDDVVEENQLANTFEKDYHKRKQMRSANASASNNASYSNNFNPPHEGSRSGSGSNPYSHRTPQTGSSSGYQQHSRGGTVTNPYKQNSRTPSGPNQRGGPARNAPNNQQNRRVNQPRYASDMLNGVTPEPAQGQRNREVSQHPHRNGRVRDQRQFGTSVGVSLNSGGMTDDLRACMASFSEPTSSKSTEDDLSDISTSSDEELLSFDVFGKE